MLHFNCEVVNISKSPILFLFLPTFFSARKKWSTINSLAVRTLMRLLHSVRLKKSTVVIVKRISGNQAAGANWPSSMISVYNSIEISIIIVSIPRQCKRA